MAYQESLIVDRPRGFAETAAIWAFGLALLALIGFALVPAGWRLGLWHYSVSFLILRYAAYLAIAAVAVSLAALAGFARLTATCRLLALAALIGGVGLAYVPWHYTRVASRLPPIHDITTDTVDPPDFWAVLPSRVAEEALPVEYGGPAVAKLQRAAYPDIVPLDAALPPERAYQIALATAQAMPGWIDVITDKSARRVEASQQSFWMGFTDDVSIRVSRHGNGSRIDVRSLSRQGSGDFGINAARIRAYLAAFKTALAQADQH